MHSDDFLIFLFSLRRLGPFKKSLLRILCLSLTAQQPLRRAKIPICGPDVQMSLVLQGFLIEDPTQLIVFWATSIHY